MRRATDRRVLLAICMWACEGLAAACSAGKTLTATDRPVTLGYGVDTTEADVAAIVTLARSYLAKPDSSPRSRAFWSRENALDARAGDLAIAVGYQAVPFTIAAVTSAGAGDSVYIVKVLHAHADSGHIMPLALQRLYAVKAPGSAHGWLLSNALPRTTAQWDTIATQAVTYHYAPGQRGDSLRRARTNEFIDSVARLFDVPRPPHIDYYVTASPDEYFRALGFDFYILPSGRGSATGGNAMPDANILLAGNPALGEAYLHEVVHLVLRGALPEVAVVNEGVATWLGGSKGLEAHALFPTLAAYQRAHPNVTLSEILTGDVKSGWTNAETDALYATGALFIEDVYRRGGVSGLRRLKRASTVAARDSQPRDPLELMRRMLPLPDGGAPNLEQWWRSAPGKFR